VTLQEGDLIWVHVPRWATFGLIVRDGKVVEAAPICRWAVGQPERTVADYLRQRGAQFRRLP
jgi:hypothetical protein